MRDATQWLRKAGPLAFLLCALTASAQVELAGSAGEEPAPIPFVSGGVGASEREELDQVKAQYNLHLLFAVARSGEFLAGIPVQIDDEAGNALLTAVSAGPYFYARLPPGHYVVTVENRGEVQSRRIRVQGAGIVSESFYWSPAQEAAPSAVE